jgi:hypothetical protein
MEEVVKAKGAATQLSGTQIACVLAREFGVAALRDRLTSRELIKLNLFDLDLLISAKTFEGKFHWAVWMSS